MKPSDFRAWLIDQKKIGFLDHFLGIIEKMRDDKMIAAGQAGDTDFIKGEAAALRWVLNLPEQLAEPIPKPINTDTETL